MFQLRGFDYSVLEAAQSCVHKFADNMGIDVEDSWITPAKSYKVGTNLPIHPAFQVGQDFPRHLINRQPF